MDSGWQRSSYSNQGNCVEVARYDETTEARESKDPDGPHLIF